MNIFEEDKIGFLCIFMFICFLLLAFGQVIMILRLKALNNETTHQLKTLNNNMLEFGLMMKNNTCRNNNIENLGIVKVFYYTNVKSMCDDTPNRTAFNEDVYEGMVAVSPDMLDYVQKGDCVFLEIDGVKKLFIVADLMNKKHRRSVDIFMFCKDNKNISEEEYKKLNSRFYSRMFLKL